MKWSRGESGAILVILLMALAMAAMALTLAIHLWGIA